MTRSTVKVELFNKDQIHLAQKGYETLADAIEPVMKEMCR